METLIINEKEVNNAVHQLKIDNSPELDNIHHICIREVTYTITYPITILFRRSIECQCIPDECKLANIAQYSRREINASLEITGQ